MKQEKPKQRNLSLFLPLGLLFVEVIAIILLLALGYEISGFLLPFFILLGLFLVFRIGRQVFMAWRVKSALKRINNADALAESGQPLEAIKIYKRNLLSLPRDKYMNVLSKMGQIYENQNMTEAIQQVKAIRSESVKFFEMSNNSKRMTPRDRRNWQARAFELRNMIQALPVEKGQDLSDVQPE